MNDEKKCDSSQECNSCGQSNTCSEEQKQARKEKRVQEKLSHIDHRIMVMSGKGGVGKSTVAANLAVTLARRGYEVGILDGDVHGPNIPKMLGLEKEKLVGTAEGMLPVPLYPNLKVLSMAFLLPTTDAPVVWRGPMKHGVFQQFLVGGEDGRLPGIGPGQEAVVQLQQAGLGAHGGSLGFRDGGTRVDSEWTWRINTIAAA